MKMIAHVCPKCGANLDIEEERTSFFCSYCGASISIDDEVERKEVVHVIRDEAKLKELELEEVKRLKQEQEEKIAHDRRVKRNIRRIIIFIILALIPILNLAAFDGGSKEEKVAILTWVVIAGIYGIFTYARWNDL